MRFSAVRHVMTASVMTTSVTALGAVRQAVGRAESSGPSRSLITSLWPSPPPPSPGSCCPAKHTYPVLTPRAFAGLVPEAAALPSLKTFPIPGSLMQSSLMHSSPTYSSTIAEDLLPFLAHLPPGPSPIYLPYLKSCPVSPARPRRFSTYDHLRRSGYH